MNSFKLVRAWNSFWFAPVSARPLGAFRIALGTLALVSILLWLRDPIPWLTDAGIMRGQEPRQIAGVLRPSVLQWVQDPLSVRVFLWSLAAVAFAFTIGWRTRVMSILLYLGTLCIHHRVVFATTGADCLLMNLLFCAMLSPCGASFSLDSLRRRRKTGEDVDALIAPWGQRLIQIQISVLYFATASFKDRGLSWLDGTAIHYPLNNEEVRRYTFGLDHAPIELLNIFTHTVLYLEFALAFLLWVRAARPAMMIFGCFLHLGMILTINAPLFSELVLAGYFAFMTPADLSRIFGGMRVFSRPRAESPPKGVRFDPPEPALRGNHPALVASDDRATVSDREVHA